MKAVILAGGSGTRLRPMTKYLNKHLLPVYNKPMIFYPISFLVLIGIKEILIICSNNESRNKFKNLLNNYKKLVSFKFKIQNKAKGIPDAMILAEEFLSKQNQKIFILGDNFFYGHALIENIKNHITQNRPTIFVKKVENPSLFGVVEFKEKKINKVIEKPKILKKNYLAITGFYIFDKNLFSKIKKLKISKRKEYEITDIIKNYKNEKNLNFYDIGRGTVWYDLGSFENLNECSNMISIFQKRNKLEIGSLNELLKSR